MDREHEFTIVEATVHTTFSWDYKPSSERQRALYEKAGAAQWSVTADIDWSVDIEFGGPWPIKAADRGFPLGSPVGCPVPPELWHDLRWSYHSWMVSQFLHGEQGALLATARLVETVPDHDSKLCAASQVIDEARHVDAYSRYVSRLGDSFPVNVALREMLEDVVSESRWDMIYLGMQIIVEGLALAVFRLGNATAPNALIRRITDLVARDEARHVAFGVVALQDLYTDLTSHERADREEFIKESALLMARRFHMQEIWERLGVDVRAGVEYSIQDPTMIEFRRLMFAKIVSNLGKLGMLTDGVREHLEDLSLIRPGQGRRRP